MKSLVAMIAVSTLFALLSVVPAHAGTSLLGPPTIGLMQAWSLLGAGAVALIWRLFSGPT